MLCYNNCYLLRLWDWRLLARAQTQKFQSWMWCWDWPRFKPRSFNLEYVIPAIDQATKLVCNSKSSMIDSLCVKMEIPLIGIPENLPWFLHPFTMYLLLFKWLIVKEGMQCESNVYNLSNGLFSSWDAFKTVFSSFLNSGKASSNVTIVVIINNTKPEIIKVPKKVSLQCSFSKHITDWLCLTLSLLRSH